MYAIKQKILSLNPLTKSAVFLMLTVLSLCLYKCNYTVWVLLFILVVSFLCGNLIKLCSVSVKTFGVLILAIFVFQPLFYYKHSDIVTFMHINFKVQGIQYAADLSLLILVFGMGFIFLMQIIDIKDLISALESKGLSKKAAYLLMATFLMIPEMKKKAKVIMEAQQCRGIEMQGNLVTRVKSFVPIIGALILGSISGTEERALALNARGFSAEIKKTSIYVLCDTKADRYVRIFSYVIILFALIGRVVFWLILK